LPLGSDFASDSALVEDAGVADDDCVVVGHGQYSPLAQNDSNENKALNRRVEVIVKR